MNIESNRTVATSARTRRTVLSVAIAVIATIPIAAGWVCSPVLAPLELVVLV